MTRLGPSHDEGPGTWPNIEYDSEFHFVYVTSNIMSTMSQCFLSKGGQIYGQDNDPNVSYSVSIDRAVAQCYQYNVFYQGECSYRQGSGPMLFVHILSVYIM